MKVIPFTSAIHKKELTQAFNEYGYRVSFHFSPFAGKSTVTIFGSYGRNDTLPVGTWFGFGDRETKDILFLRPDEVRKTMTQYVVNKYKFMTSEGESNYE